MNVTVSRRRLLEALDIAKAWVSPPKAIPACHAVVLSQEMGGLVLQRSDLDRAVALRVDAEIHDEGQAAVSAAALHRIAKTSRAAALDLELAEPGDRETRRPPILRVSVAASTFELVGFFEEDTEPIAPKPEPLTPLAQGIPASTLRWLFGSVVYAAGASDDSPTDCLELTFERGVLRAIATDGHRAAIADLLHPKVQQWPDPVYLPADSAAKFLTLKADCMTSLYATPTGRLVLALGGLGDVSCRMLDRTFPNVARAVEGYLSEEGEAVAQREQLLAALDRATAVLGGAPVRLTVGDDQVSLTGATDDGAKVVERFPARAKRAASIGLRPVYLSEALRALTASEVSLCLSPHALAIRPVLQDAMTQSQVSIVMECVTPPAADKLAGFEAGTLAEPTPAPAAPAPKAKGKKAKTSDSHAESLDPEHLELDRDMRARGQCPGCGGPLKKKGAAYCGKCSFDPSGSPTAHHAETTD